MDELVQSGQTRRDALRQVARENMQAEVSEGLSETLQSGTLPGCAWACGAVCGAFLVVLLALSAILCVAVCACSGVLHLCGWFLIWWLMGCGQQRELRLWLLFFQLATLLEACLCNLIHGCAQKVAETLDSRVRPGFARFCDLVYRVMSFGLKVIWCCQIQVLIARRTAKDDAEQCGYWLPRFMCWYSAVLLLQLLIVEPALRTGMGLALTFATRGLLQTTRGAKPGTLGGMQVVTFREELFAQADDPSDDRPQKECCFCLEEYEGSTAIVRTPCRHIMHRECLAKWLQTSHFCPICRGDLEEEGEDPDPEEDEVRRDLDLELGRISMR